MVRYCKEYWDDACRALDVIAHIEKLGGKTVFIAGGTGLIGSSAADLLFAFNKKYSGNVRVIIGGRSHSRTENRFPGQMFDFVPLDVVSGTDFLIEADYLIFAAGNASPSLIAGEPVETFLANTTGLNAMLQTAGRGRVLYVSSGEVYGKRNRKIPFTEQDCSVGDCSSPRCVYPRAKAAGEALCAAYIREYGTDVVIARPGYIYGPAVKDADDRVQAQFMRNALNGENIAVKGGSRKFRSYCYSLDCASALLTMLTAGSRGRAYNVSHSAVTIEELAETFARESGEKVVHCAENEAAESTALDSSRLENLGWRAMTQLREGVKKTLRFYEVADEKGRKA